MSKILLVDDPAINLLYLSKTLQRLPGAAIMTSASANGMVWNSFESLEQCPVASRPRS
jgi:CheY-like chemotaxis protein